MQTKDIPSIVVGMAPYELKRPYHPLISCEDIRRVYRYIRNRDSFKFETALQATPTIDDLSESGARTIEIYGSWLQLCVAGATAHSLTKGLNVVIPKKYTFTNPSPEVSFPLKYGVQLYICDNSKFDELMNTYNFVENSDYYSFVR